MQQRLIVEGKDAIVLTVILDKKGIPSPKGYHNKYKYKTEFVKMAEGESKVKTVLKEQLDSPDIERIGIIVDADKKGPENKFKGLIDFIQKETGETLTKPELASTGFYYQLKDKRTIGIWVMPDNLNEGYLENFVGAMIAEDDLTWQFCQEKVEELSKKDFCLFSETKTQKALVHTYLAWQKTPGLPLGTAVKAEFLSIENQIVNNFVDWFKNTFELVV